MTYAPVSGIYKITNARLTDRTRQTPGYGGRPLNHPHNHKGTTDPMTTTQVDNHDAKYDSLLKGDYVKTIANGLDFFVGETPAGFDKTSKSFFEIIDQRAGDVKLMWDRTKQAEIDAAQATFDTLIKKGYAAFLVKDNDGNKGEKITKFDPNAERIIMISPIAGG